MPAGGIPWSGKPGKPCRQTGMALLHMHSVFPTERGKQAIMMSFSDVMNVKLTHRVGGYIRRVCTSLEAVIYVFGAEHSGNLLRSH